MHSKIAGIALVCILLAGAARGDAARALLSTPIDPSRMSLSARYGTDASESPQFYMPGGCSAFSFCAWIRYNNRYFDQLHDGQGQSLAVLCPMQMSMQPARPTRSGGDELPAFFEAAELPLSAGGTWGASVLPQDAETLDYGLHGDCYVVCVNVETDSALTMTLGGEEVQIPASNGVMQVRNVAVPVGDTTATVAAASASASVSLAMAVNPWIEFIRVCDENWFSGYDNTGNTYDKTLPVTNVFVFVSARLTVAPGGNLFSIVDKIGLDGRHDAYTNSFPTAWTDGTIPRNVMFRWPLGAISGFTESDDTPRRVERFGVKAQAANAPWTDTQMWRLWERDAAELRRRGLDGYLPSEVID